MITIKKLNLRSPTAESVSERLVRHQAALCTHSSSSLEVSLRNPNKQNSQEVEGVEEGSVRREEEMPMDGEEANKGGEEEESCN